MRTRLPYVVSAALHAGAYGVLAWASANNSESPQFAVRQGESTALYSQPSRARAVTVTLDSRIEPDPRATVEIAAPEIPPQKPPEPPVQPATAADLDDRIVLRPPIEESVRRRTERSTDFTPLPEATPMVADRPESTPETDGRPMPSLLLPVPEQEAPPPDRLQPDRPLVAAKPVQATQVFEDGAGTVNAVGARVDQGSKVESLPANLPANPVPPYPEELRRQRIGGQVLLWLVIAPDGTVADVRVDKSSGYTALDESAVKTVRLWRFAPARRGGQPVRFEVRLPITFSVRGG